jgi:hypothetical protein
MLPPDSTSIIGSRDGPAIGFSLCQDGSAALSASPCATIFKNLPVLTQALEIQALFPNYPSPSPHRTLIGTSPQKAVLGNQFPNDFLVMGEQVGITKGKFYEAIGRFNVPQLPGRRYGSTIRPRRSKEADLYGASTKRGGVRGRRSPKLNRFRTFLGSSRPSTTIRNWSARV